MKKILLLLSAGCFSAHAQQLGANVSGNVETTFQYLNADTLIGANQPAEKAVMNNYALVNYSLKDFRAGVRFGFLDKVVTKIPPRPGQTTVGVDALDSSRYTHDPA